MSALYSGISRATIIVKWPACYNNAIQGRILNEMKKSRIYDTIFFKRNQIIHEDNLCFWRVFYGKQA